MCYTEAASHPSFADSFLCVKSLSVGSSFHFTLYIVKCMCVFLQQDRVQANNGVLTISSLSLADIGMYQCVAENKHGRIFTNAELRVIGKSKPTTSSQVI